MHEEGTEKWRGDEGIMKLRPSPGRPACLALTRLRLRFWIFIPPRTRGGPGLLAAGVALACSRPQVASALINCRARYIPLGQARLVTMTCVPGSCDGHAQLIISRLFLAPRQSMVRFLLHQTPTRKVSESRSVLNHGVKTLKSFSNLSEWNCFGSTWP